MAELKPCPFCGGGAKIIAPLGFGNIRAADCCNDECSATGPWGRNEGEAATAWNTRADEPALAQRTAEIVAMVREMYRPMTAQAIEDRYAK